MGRSGLQIWQMSHVMVGLQVGCDGSCMVWVVKMPARDITIFQIFLERSVAVKFRSLLKIIGLESVSKISHFAPL